MGVTVSMDTLAKKVIQCLRPVSGHRYFSGHAVLTKRQHGEFEVVRIVFYDKYEFFLHWIF